MMRQRRAFRPTELGPLEDRIALSLAGGGAEVSAVTAGATLSATTKGTVVTTLPKGIGGAYHAHLTSTVRVPKFGAFGLVGDLSDNGSLPPPYSNTQGTLTFTALNHSGSLTVKVNGPPSNLAPKSPTTIHLSFTVTSATGVFSSAVGDKGSAVLTLATPGKPHSGTVRGTFTLSASIRIG